MKNCWWKQKILFFVCRLAKLSRIDVTNAKWFSVKSIWFCFKLPLSSIFKWTFLYFLKPILKSCFLPLYQPPSVFPISLHIFLLQLKNRKEKKLFIQFFFSSLTLNINNKRISKRNYKKFWNKKISLILIRNGLIILEFNKRKKKKKKCDKIRKC